MKIDNIQMTLNENRQYTDDSDYRSWASPKIFLKLVEQTLCSGTVPIKKDRHRCGSTRKNKNNKKYNLALNGQTLDAEI